MTNAITISTIVNNICEYLKKKQTKEVEVNLFKKYKYKHFSEEDINFMFLVINNNFALLREPCFYIFITRCIFFFNNFSIFILYYTSYLFRISYLAFVSLFISVLIVLWSLHLPKILFL